MPQLTDVPHHWDVLFVVVLFWCFLFVFLLFLVFVWLAFLFCCVCYPGLLGQSTGLRTGPGQPSFEAI